MKHPQQEYLLLRMLHIWLMHGILVSKINGGKAMKNRMLKIIAAVILLALFAPAFPVKISLRTAEAVEGVPEVVPTIMEVPTTVEEEIVFPTPKPQTPTPMVTTKPTPKPTVTPKPTPTPTPKPKATPTPKPKATPTPKPKATPTPVVASKKITLNLSAITIGKGQSVKTIKAKAENGASITWESQNPDIATVNQKGKITGVKKGTATIVLSASGCAKAYVKVTVVGKNKGVQRITLPRSFSLQRTKTKQLRVAFSPSKPKDKTVIWTSSDKNIVSVDAGGLVTAVKVGKATITATSSSGKQDTVTITVKPLLVKSVTISGKATMKAGETQTLTAAIKPAGADNQKLKWKSSNKSIATVDGSGVVTAKKKGKVIITATAKDGSGKKDSITIKVKKAAEPADYPFSYFIYEDGVYIAKGKRGYKNIVIPEKIEGRPVTVIEQFAFDGFTELESVTLPGTLKTIDQYAFSNTGLKSVTIPGGVKETGYNAFADCTSLRTLNVSEGVEAIDTKSFYGCTALRTVKLPSTVKIIYDNAFYACDSLESIVLPDSVKEVRDGAFDGCSSLKYLTANGLENIGDNAFIHCGFEKLKLPKVKTIGICAFGGCMALTDVDLGKYITYIDESAFAYCRSLGRTYLPPSLTYIDVWAFEESWEFVPVVTRGTYAHTWAETYYTYYEFK